MFCESTDLISAGAGDIFVTMFDSSGNLLWAKQAGSPEGIDGDQGYDIVMDSSGNSYITGFFEGAATFGNTIFNSGGKGDLFVAKYDGSGNFLWGKQASGEDWIIGEDLTLAPSGEIYVTGMIRGTAQFDSIGLTSNGYSDIFLAKIEAEPPPLPVIVRMDPQITILEAGQACSINVVIENVYNLGAFQFDVVYNTDVVHGDGVLMGPFLSSTGRTVIPVGPEIDNANISGKLTFGGATFGGMAGPDGSGLLATLIFTTQASGSTQLELQNVQVSDINGQTIQIDSLLSGELEVPSLVGNWEVQQSGIGARLYGVKAVSGQVAWAVGRWGVILRTVNGGQQWENIGGVPDTALVFDVEAFDSQRAFIVANEGVLAGGTNNTYISKTTNGGANWTKVYDQTGGWVTDIQMFDNTHGMAIGDPLNGYWVIKESFDGGSNWQPITNPLPAIGAEYGYSVNWVNNSICWFGTDSSRAYYSSDGGQNWSIVEIPPLQNITRIAFTGSGIGLVAGDSQIFQTTDQGTNWQEVTSPVAGGFIYSLMYHNNYFWLLINNFIYRSSDDGLNWTLETTGPANLRYLSLVTDAQGTYGWAVGNQGTILRYSDDYTGVSGEKKGEIPAKFVLYQNYPNPFNPSTTIKFTLFKTENVKIEIFNSLSQKVTTLVNRKLPVGYHEVKFNAINLPSGIYVYKITAGNFKDVRKMLLLK